MKNDPEVIRDAAERQMAHVRRYQLGEHSALSQKILNEVGAAKACLLDEAKKAAYDEQLRAQLETLRQLERVLDQSPPAPPDPPALAPPSEPSQPRSASLSTSNPVLLATGSPSASRAASPRKAVRRKRPVRRSWIARIDAWLARLAGTGNDLVYQFLRFLAVLLPLLMGAAVVAVGFLARCQAPASQPVVILVAGRGFRNEQTGAKFA